MLDRPPISEAMEPKLQARVTAIDCYISAAIKGGTMGDAVRLFDERWNTAERTAAGQDIKAPEHFVPYQVNKLYEKATLRDCVDHPRPPKMPDAKVKEAADILAKGYTLPCMDDSTGVLYMWYETRHFTSIAQATRLSPELYKMMVDFDVTPRYLLDRMHEVCPKLVFSALPIKMELSPQQKHARQEYAAWMLEQLELDPWFLHKIIWGDESRIYVGRELDGKLKVYHFTGQADGAGPEECCLLNKEHMIRIDLVLFVSAVWGCCHVEFLTGTTDINTDGRQSAGMQAAWAQRVAQGLGPYKTKKSGYKNKAKACTAEEFADNLNSFLPQLQQKLIAATGWNHLVSLDGASIHKVQDAPYILGYPETFLNHPAHSPDLHQVIEHRFAELKQYLVNRVYQIGFERCTVQLLRQIVLGFCATQITPAKIESELANLKLCYQVVAAPTYQWVLVGRQNYAGVAGGWPPKRFR